MSLSKIKDIILKNKKLIIMGVFVFVMFFPEMSFATEMDKNEFDKILSIIIGLLQFVIYLFSAIAGIITFMVGMFLSPEWTTGSIFGMTKYLKDMWILVSNIVYFIFAFLLIVIAFMNIVGKGGEWELKQALPRFIVGVLIVPFSWFFIQFMLSLSSILTISVLSLPSDSFTDYTKKLEEKRIICKEYEIDFSKIGANIASKSSEGAKVDDTVMGCSKGTEKMTIATLLQNNPFGILTVYTYGVMDFESIDKLKSANLKGGISKIGDLFQKGLFDIIFAAIYLILLITLGLVMMIRGFYLWIFMMISPVFGLLYFFKGKEGDSFKDFNIKTFFGLAMVPVYVSAALAFGLLFIVTVSSQNPDTTNQTNSTVTISEKGFTLGTKGSDGAVTINMTGLGEGSQAAAKVGSDLLSAGKGILGKLIMEIFALVVLWMAVMAAFRSSTMTEAITKPIMEFGTSIGNLAKSAPSYLPVFGGQSATSLGQGMQQFTGKFQSIQNDKGSKWATAAGQKFGVEQPEYIQKQIDIMNKSAGFATTDKQKMLLDSINNIDVSQLTNSAYRKQLQEVAIKAGIDKKTVERIYNSNNITKESLAEALRDENGKLGQAGEGDNKTIFSNVASIKKEIGESLSNSSKKSGEEKQKTPTPTNSAIKDFSITLKHDTDNKIISADNNEIVKTSETFKTEDIKGITKENFIKDFKERLIEKQGKDNITDDIATKIAKAVTEEIDKTKDFSDTKKK